jgi:hypothetical protein
LKIRKANPPEGKSSIMLSDGGLKLLVARSKDGKSINKSWTFRFTRNGKTRDIGLGPWGDRDVTLIQAREKAAEARRHVRQGIDPIEQRKAGDEQRKAEDAAKRANERKTATFEECTTLYLAQHRAGWKTPGYERDWKNSLANHAFPHIGKLDLALIDIPHIRLVLDPIWSTKPVLAGHVRDRVEGRARSGDDIQVQVRGKPGTMARPLGEPVPEAQQGAHGPALRRLAVERSTEVYATPACGRLDPSPCPRISDPDDGEVDRRTAGQGR